MAKAEDVPQLPKRDYSTNPNRPKALDVCIIKLSNNRRIDGIVMHYFDDINGIEHVRVDCGPIQIVRPSTDIE